MSKEISAMALIVEGLNAVKEVIKKMTAVPAEVTDAQNQLREELNALSKKQLIELLIAERIKGAAIEPRQKDLLYEIFMNPATTALTYDEISECILENLNTELKYSPHNVSWWRSRFVTEGAEFPARMTAAERNKLDRKIAMAALSKK